jgi:hypothetical protein
MADAMTVLPLGSSRVDIGSYETGTPAIPMTRTTYDHEAFAADLDQVLGEIRETLIAKNKAYGSSALDPVRIFSKASTREQLLVRMDDKLSRLERGSAAGEDVLLDLLGYLLLLRIAELREERT